MKTTRNAPPLLVFADDWGRHPSSCQHLIRRLLARHEVCWVNTIGTRSPRLELATLARAAEKARHWLSPARPQVVAPATPNLRVINPKMWPWFRSSLDRGLNRGLLVRQLAPLIDAMPAPPIAVTTLPIVADLIGHLSVERWIYYCVDDFGQWPGLDQAPLRRLETLLVAKADTLITASEALRERLAAMGRTSQMLSHGVDSELWSGPGDDEPLPEVDGLSRPLVVFWGLIDRRLDVAFLKRLSDDLKSGTIVLVGPEADPDPALSGISRLVRLPPMPFERLPRLAREAGVLVMPYADAPVTRAFQPLKLKEYLATGKPVVVRDLPATRPWADCLDLADHPEEFSRAVRLRLATGLPGGQDAARSRLAMESWSDKARAFGRWIEGHEINEGRSLTLSEREASRASRRTR
jgi:glycosyltransferase involved in cell wall biosynthesis